AAFLVRGSEGAVLVETGPMSTVDVLIGELRLRGYEPKDISAVFLTHIHLDHAGAAGIFGEAGVPVHVHPKGAKHLVDPTRLIESARMVYGEQFDSLWGMMKAIPEELVVPVEDRELLSIGGLRIEVIETPGHAFHHHSYRIGESLFAGDAAGARVDRSGYLSVTSAPPQFHLSHTLASLERLIEVESESLYLTHFGLVPDRKSHLRAYAEAVDLSAEFVRSRLEEGMDDEALAVAYEAFQLEQAFRLRVPRERWNALQAINGTGMCADGIRIFWEREAE
ncbi:MAG: MBL fold metallo-hydrolase, partial [Verrucomicrobiota bacterium]